LAHQHFGPLIISCDKADLQPSATGITIYADRQKSFVVLPAPVIPRIEVIDELFAAARHDHPPVHSGSWARATTAVGLAMLESARTQTEQQPGYQVKPGQS
jgi:phthalate 4,5-cis-dihydrodiol dehydrogenase